MTIIGITGTRNGMTAHQRQFLADFLATHQPTELHHGDCVGADEDSHQIALGVCWIVIHPPEDSRLRAFCDGNDHRDPKPYHDRNRDIVDECDWLLAFPAEMERQSSGGTWYTIRYAESVNRQLTIAWPAAYKVIVTCRECTGNDPMGCGEGEPWTLQKSEHETALFHTREEAQHAILKEKFNALYEYNIVEAR